MLGVRRRVRVTVRMIIRIRTRHGFLLSLRL